MQSDGYMHPPQKSGGYIQTAWKHAGRNSGAYDTGTLLGNLLLTRCIAYWRGSLSNISVFVLGLTSLSAANEPFPKKLFTRLHKD